MIAHQLKVRRDAKPGEAWCGVMGAADHLHIEVDCEPCLGQIAARRVELFGAPAEQPLPSFVPGPRLKRTARA